MSSSPAAGAEAAAPASRRVDRQRRARRKAAWRRRGLVLLFLSPWIVGFSVFFAYPLVMSAYLSFTSYDLLSPPRWVGLANYRYLFHGRSEIGTAVQNTLWLIACRRAAAGRFAFGSR